MIMDNQLLFSNAQSLITNANTPSSVIDMLGGVAINKGNATAWGQDLGIGDGEAIPKIACFIGTGFTTVNSATLNVAFQGSTDSSTWTTYVETGPIPASKLIAGAKIAAFDWPLRDVEATALPRYIRLLYQLPAATAFTAGSIFLAGIVIQRGDWAAGQYPSNFIAA